MAKWLDALERRVGPRLPGNLTYILVALTATAVAVGLVSPELLAWVRLDPALVKQGQLWRLVTFIVVPTTLSPMAAIGSVVWLYQIGTRLEREWGPAKFFAWWVVGTLATATASIVFDVPGDTGGLLLSLFLAFATLYPNEERMVAFVLPVKVKWLALIDVAMLLLLVQSLPGWRKLLPIIGVSNYLLFFGPELVGHARRWFKQGKRAADWQKKRGPAEPTVVKRNCSICGVSSDDPEEDIRVCTCPRCTTPTAFCVEHAREHAAEAGERTS